MCKSYRVGLYGAVISFLLAVLSLPVSAEPMQEVTLTASVNAENVNVWLPATLTLHKGDKVKLTLKNAATKDHGFAIEGFELTEVIAINESKEVVIHAEKAGTFKFFCPLHKGHVGGQLTVQ